MSIEPKQTKEPKAQKPKKVPKAEKAEPELCSVCADHYTPILRKKVVCKFCSKDTCCKCIEQYLLNRHEDAHCLHCRVNYSDQVLREICTKTYLTQVYFKHRQEVLVNRERVQLPPLQDEAIRARALRQGFKDLRVLSDQKKKLEIEMRQAAHATYRARSRYAKARQGQEILTPEEITQLEREIVACTQVERELAERRREVKKEGQQLRTRLWRIRYRRNPETGERERGEEDGDEKEEKEEKRKFIRRCMRPNCTGFLSTAWKCGICDWYSCSKCLGVRGEHHDSPHECKKEDIETADLIRSQSKPCPKCGEFIEKSSGCNQMYCISCHTPWDWVTGKIVTHGVIHNPHYYEWLKRTGGAVQRNPADVPCGGYPNGWDLVSLSPLLPKDLTRFWIEFHRLCMEVQDQSEHNYRTHLDQQSTQTLHINYLLGDYNDARWGQLLAINEKKKKRDAEIQDVFNAFRMVAVELINRIQNYREHGRTSFTYVPLKEAEPYLAGVVGEMKALIQMINDAFKAISISHSYSVPYICSLSLNPANTLTTLALRSKNWSTVTRGKKKATEEEKEGEPVRVAASKEADQVLESDSESEEEEHENRREPFLVPTLMESEDDDEIIQIQRAIAESLQ